MNKYERGLSQLALARGTIDIYDIDELFPMANTAFIHARKKLFNAGNRSGGKSLIQDIEEAIASLEAGLLIEKDKHSQYRDETPGTSRKGVPWYTANGSSRYAKAEAESPDKTGEELIGLMCHPWDLLAAEWSDETVCITGYKEGQVCPYVSGTTLYMDAKEADSQN